jgi:hypothetical protein
MQAGSDTPVGDETPTLEAKAEWPSEREWQPDDARWKLAPQMPDPARIPTIEYDRARCPLIPLQDYVVLRVDKIDFLSLSGVAVAADVDDRGSGSHAPILTVVRVGPDVKDYKPGDYVLTNPRNNEFALEWADPRPPHTSVTYIMMREKVLIARYDHDVVNELKKRGRYCEKVRQERDRREAEERAAKERLDSSPLNPRPHLEVLDATGQPASKRGYHRE